MDRKLFLKTVGLAWLVSLGFDFFLHGGILATVYDTGGPFFLEPETQFRLIPIGYISFLLITILLVGLMGSLRISGGREGARFGLKLGALIWGAETLGLLSISTAPPLLMAGWFLGQTIELTIAGWVAGLATSGSALRPLLFKVVLFVFVMFALTILIQSVIIN